MDLLKMGIQDQQYQKAAKYAKTIADWYESADECELATPYYLTAAEHFASDNADGF